MRYLEDKVSNIANIANMANPLPNNKPTMQKGSNPPKEGLVLNQYFVNISNKWVPPQQQRSTPKPPEASSCDKIINKFSYTPKIVNPLACLQRREGCQSMAKDVGERSIDYSLDSERSSAGRGKKNTKKYLYFRRRVPGTGKVTSVSMDQKAPPTHLILANRINQNNFPQTDHSLQHHNVHTHIIYIYIYIERFHDHAPR